MKSDESAWTITIKQLSLRSRTNNHQNADNFDDIFVCVEKAYARFLSILEEYMKWTNIELLFKFCFSMLFLLGVKFNILTLQMKQCIIF